MNFGENTVDKLFHTVISIKGAAGDWTILKYYLYCSLSNRTLQIFMKHTC